MTIDISTAELAIACAFLGGQIATLAGVVRSNISQGRRLGLLENWQSNHDAVRAYREKRANAPVLGVPTHTDEC